MERPSHISFPASHLSRRLPFFALAAFFQVGAVLLIMTGFGHHKPTIFVDTVFVPEPDKVDPKPPPPPDPNIAKKLIVDIPPVEHWDTERLPAGGVTVQTRTATNDQPPRPQPPVVDRAATAVTATHTQPPYPPIAIRQNLEGTVLLRLTVLETGRVGKADIATGSGSEILDQAAQSWIVGHWAYKPAMSGGQPVASQAMASVTFNLKNAR